MSWLLLSVPVAVALEHLAPQRHLPIFVGSGLAIPPLASWMIVALAFFFVPATLPYGSPAGDAAAETLTCLPVG